MDIERTRPTEVGSKFGHMTGRTTPTPSSGDSVGTIASYLSRYVQVCFLYMDPLFLVVFHIFVY